MERSRLFNKEMVPEISETNRLQKDLEAMTLRLEQERRQSSFLDEQIEILEFEIRDTITVPSGRGKEIGALKRKLDLENSKLNKFKSDNQFLRDKIEVARKEIQQCRRILEDLNTQKTTYKTMREDRVSDIEKCEKVDIKQRRKIMLLRSRSADACKKHSRIVSNLNSFIKDELEHKNLACKEMEKMFTKNVNRQTNVLHVSWYLKSMLNWWRQRVKNAKTALDNYLKYIKEVREGFQQIELATGIDEVDEIVTTFIKGDAQQYDVVSYLNSLSREIEILEESYREIKANIQEYETNTHTNQNMITDTENSLNAEIKKVGRKIEEKKLVLTKIDNEFEKSFALFALMAQVLKKIKEIQVDNLDYFKEKREIVLGELEQAIVNVKMLESFNNHQASPLLKRVPLDILDKKNFEPTPVFIEEVEIYSDEVIESYKYPLPLIDLKRKAKELSLRKRSNVSDILK